MKKSKKKLTLHDRAKRSQASARQRIIERRIVQNITTKSLNAQQRLDKLRVDAKQRVAERGTVQFRLDKDSMLHLMHVADKKKVPVGTLVRMWMIERLINEPKPA